MIDKERAEVLACCIALQEVLKIYLLLSQMMDETVLARNELRNVPRRVKDGNLKGGEELIIEFDSFIFTFVSCHCASV